MLFRSYDPLFAADKIFAPGKKQLDTKGDYLMRLQGAAEARSEERRVGKECRSGW